MSFETFESFKLSYDKAGGGWSNVPAEKAWALYTKARKPPLMCTVVGCHVTLKIKAAPKKTKWSPEEPVHAPNDGGIQWFGGGGLTNDPNSPTGVSGAEDHVAENFGLVAETTGIGDKFTGSILGAAEWDKRINDTWVLAGIHGMLPAYCASPLTQGNLLDDTYFLSMTGREVAGLLMFGYRKVISNTTGKLGDVLECKDNLAAFKATYSAYNQRLAKLKSKGDALALLKELGLNI